MLNFAPTEAISDPFCIRHDGNAWEEGGYRGITRTRLGVLGAIAHPLRAKGTLAGTTSGLTTVANRGINRHRPHLG